MVELKKNGFTLIELLMAISVVTILSGVVLVGMQSSIGKSKRTSAVTSAASVFPELVACMDDKGGTTAYSAGALVCTVVGHKTTWPNLSNTGWTIVSSAQAVITNDFSYILRYSAGGQSDVTCRLSTSDCT